MQTLLVDGDTEVAYASRRGISSSRDNAQAFANDRGHATTCAIATAAARAGWTRLDFHQTLLRSPARGGRHVQNIAHRRGHDRAIGYLDRIWERVSKLVAEQGICSRQDAVWHLVDIKSRIATTSWGGLTGSTDLKMLTAHMAAAEKAGGPRHTLAYREAAEYAGVSLITARRSTKRLLRAGWLHRIDTGTDKHGSTWILLKAPGDQQASGEGISTEVVASLMGLDAFAHRGLGATGLKILAALAVQDGQTVQELMGTASISQATAYRRLSRLAEHDLVVKDTEVWKLTQTAREGLPGDWAGWNQVAASVGTYGTAWRRRQLHEDQRAAWHGQILPRLRERRMPDVKPIRGDEVDPAWVIDGRVVDPRTGQVMEEWVIATDGRLLLVG